MLLKLARQRRRTTLNRIDLEVMVCASMSCGTVPRGSAPETAVGCIVRRVSECSETQSRQLLSAWLQASKFAHDESAVAGL